METKEDKKISKISAETWSQMYLEELKFIFTAEANAIRAAMLINGGAAVALLSFIANIINKDKNIEPFAFSMFIYVVSILSAAVCYWLSAWSQRCYSAHKFNPELTFRKTLSGLINDVSVFLLWLSYIGFGYGSWLTYAALINFNNG